ncbi:MAG: gamma-glutamyl-phosphate reductase, partial [Schaalia hyovaginalis]|nr:gamma-glutamyl-phosphate reductase [Schaalia hyovaginalis]
SGADLEAAERIIMNAKTQRVGVCNAAETLLVHRDEAERFLSSALTRLATAGVTLHLDETGLEIARRDASIDEAMIAPACEEDWAAEYLSMDLAVRVVDSIDEAIEHIRTYSSGHTEAICTSSLASANRFRTELDSAAIAINASTRFTDGGQLGLGAEIGISTQKLHARGPMGLAELTTSTWIIEGEGTVRP